MAGRYKPVAFEPHGRRRTRRGLPSWLVLLLTGVVIGAGGVILVQERYMAPRLSAADSANLRASLAQTETERNRLKDELTATTTRLQATLGEKKGLADQLSASQQTTERLRQDVASVLASLPPDPRGGAVEVRAGRFSVDAGKLVYDVMLTRDRAGSKPFNGVMQLIVVGDSGRGSDTTVALKPVAISVGAYQSLRGSLQLPEDFKPNQTTVRVLDRVDGHQQGMRVLYVK